MVDISRGKLAVGIGAMLLVGGTGAFGAAADLGGTGTMDVATVTETATATATATQTSTATATATPASTPTATRTATPRPDADGDGVADVVDFAPYDASIQDITDVHTPTPEPTATPEPTPVPFAVENVVATDAWITVDESYAGEGERWVISVTLSNDNADAARVDFDAFFSPNFNPGIAVYYPVDGWEVSGVADYADPVTIEAGGTHTHEWTETSTTLEEWEPSEMGYAVNVTAVEQV